MPTFPSTLPDNTTFRNWLGNTNLIIDILSPDANGSSNIVVAGANAIGTFAIGNTVDTGSSLTVGGTKLLVNTTVFAVEVSTTVNASLTVAGASSTTTIGGANVFLQPTNTVFVNSATMIVRANATFQNAKSTFSGNVEFNGTNTAITAGTFLVTIPATFNSVTINSATISSFSLTGAVSFVNTMSVTGATTLSNTLAVTGAATLSNTLGVTGAATLNNTLAVTGAATLSNTLTLTGFANLNSTLRVAGAANMISTLGVTGAVTLSSSLVVSGNTTLSGNVTANGALLTSLNASALTTGTVGTDRLGSGTANSTTFLAGDGQWRTPTVASSVPTGTILMTAASTPDSGYLFCDGSAQLKASYSALATLVGNTYATGNTTHFYLPDLRQRFPIGANTGFGIGTAGGNWDHTHTGPSHTHTINGHTHTISGHTHTFTTSTGGDHTHSVGLVQHGHYYSDTTDGPSATVSVLSDAVDPLAFETVASSGHTHGTAGYTGGIDNVGANTTSTSSGSHNHTGTTDTSGTLTTASSGTLTTNADGTGATGTANPPYLVLNFQIKF